MITPFNRKELFVTFEMRAQALVRDALSTHGIDYQLKTRSFSSGGSHLQYPAAPMLIEYRFYVRKEDYEKALFLIQSKKPD